jgi:hypothetical protein
MSSKMSIRSHLAIFTATNTPMDLNLDLKISILKFTRLQNKLRYPNLKLTNSSFFSKICKNAIRYTMDWISIILFAKIFIDLFKQINPNIIHINNGGYPGSLSCRVAAIISGFTRQSRTVFVVNNRPVNYSPLFRKFDKPV